MSTAQFRKAFARALRMWDAGYTIREIAGWYGYSVGGMRCTISVARKRHGLFPLRQRARI